MSRRKKIILWVGGAIGIVLVLLLILILLLPRLINIEPVRERILATISQTVGGKVELQQVDLSFFPRPRVVVHKASLSIPGKVAGTLESATIYPEILPLFRGRVRITMLEIEAPDVKIELPERPEKKKERPKAVSPASIEEEVGSLLAFMVSKAPGLVVLVEKGRLNIAEANRSVFWFQDIEVRIGLPPDRLRIDVTCRSNLWERLSLNGSLDAKDFTGSGRIDLIRFQPQELPDHLLPPATPRVGDSEVNLSLSFKIDGLRALQAELEGSIPYLTLHQADEELVIKGKSLRGALDLDEDRVTVSLTGFDLEYPRLNLSGKFHLDQAAPSVSVVLECRDVDVDSTRQVALALAGKVPTIQDIFDMVRGGEIPLITLNAQGSSMADLGKMENIFIKGSIVDGKIFISGEELNLEGLSFELDSVKGDVVISQGILEGENLEAQWGNTQVHEGKLRLGLEGEDAPLHLEVAVEADLAELPVFLEPLIDGKISVAEIARTYDIKGKALARLVVAESTESIKVTVDVSRVDLFARYERIPYHLEIHRGQVSYDVDKVEVKNLSGKLGKSSFSALTAQVGLGKAPHLEILSGKLLIFLGEIYSWLSSFKGLNGALKDIGSVQGTVALSALHLKGPLSRPEKWRFRMAGEVENFAMESTRLPGRVAVSQAKFEATPERLSLTDAQTRFLDTSLRVSGVASGYLEGLSKVDLAFQGSVGPETTEWGANLIDLPPRLRVRAPLSILQAHVGLNSNGDTSFSGDLAVKDGPKVSIDMRVNPDEMIIKRSLIQDNASHASFAATLKERELHLSYSGHLDKTTLDGLLVKNEILTGRLDGDFEAHILLDHPMRSTARGKLHGVGLGHPLRLKIPVTIENFSVNAKKNRLNVESALVTWGENHLTLDGNLEFSEEDFLFDMNLSADGIGWDHVEQILEGVDQEGDPEAQGNSRSPVIEGVLRVRLGYFEYERFTWRPFHADISFHDDGVEVRVTEANLCGISTPGVVKVTSQDLSLDFKPVSKSQELNPTLNCLLSEQVRVTGNFDFKGEVMARAKPEELARSLRGNFEIVATDGVIYEEIRFERVLAFLNLTEIFVGKLPDMREEGFAYDSIKIKGNLKNGRLMIEEAIMDAAVMKMASKGEIDLIDQKIDFMVLVAPLKTVDRVIKHIPLVRHILGGTLISIPIAVKGDMANPKVSALSASAVGSELLGIVKRTFGLPVEMVKPLTSGKKKKQDAPQEQAD